MIQVNKGIYDAAERLLETGVQVIVKENPSVDEEAQLKSILELEEAGIQALAIMPVDCDRIREKLK